MEMTARRCVASRVSTRSVLIKRYGATELTIQPIREEVRTFHGSQHTYYQLHRSRLSNARATTTQPKHSTELALCPRCHLAWASEGTLVGPGMDTHGAPVPSQWEGHEWLDCTQEHMAPEHATDTNVPKTDTLSYKHVFGDPCAW